MLGFIVGFINRVAKASWLGD